MLHLCGSCSQRSWRLVPVPASVGRCPHMTEYTNCIIVLLVGRRGPLMPTGDNLLRLPPSHPYRTLAVGDYRPKDVAADVWALALPVVIEVLAADACLPDHDPETAMGRRSVLAHYAAYVAAQDPRRLQMTVLMDEDVMAQYVASNPQQARRTHRSRQVAMSQLRSFRRAFTASGKPRRGATPVAGTLQPLSDREFDIATRAAATFRSRVTMQRTRAWLALGRGAGLSGADMRWVTATSVQARSDAGLWVLVERPGAEREVPVLERFADEIELLAAELSTGALIAAGATPCDADVPSTIGSTLTRAVRSAGHPNLLISVERLRKAWLAEHLRHNTPINTLLAAAGLTSLRSLEGLVADHAPARPDDVEEVARQLGAIQGGASL